MGVRGVGPAGRPEGAAGAPPDSGGAARHRIDAEDGLEEERGERAGGGGAEAVEEGIGSRSHPRWLISPAMGSSQGLVPPARLLH